MAPMHPPGPDPLDGSLSEVARLVAECLERADSEGVSAVEQVCAEHPEHAEELRARLASLRDLGLFKQERIGPYRLLRTLGHGGMGLVYLAHDERLGREVALKALPSRLSLNPRSLERFQREVRAAARLQHPRIVPIYDVGEMDGVPYFTMEYVDGRTLAEVVTALGASGEPVERLSVEHLATALRGGSAAAPEAWGRSYIETVCRLALDVADALDHAHEHGIVHRDVKPNNILVRRDGRAQLFDFGLAQAEFDDSMTRTGDFTGTPFYVSPEQAQSRNKALDRRTDVYSLGVTLYELLTLQRPFTGRNTQDVLRNILGREPTLPRRINPMIPRDLETICLAALEKDPAKRYQSAAELAADLRRFLRFEPVRARPVGAVTRLARLARRNRAAALAVVLGVVLVVGTPLGLWHANAAIRLQRDEAERQQRVAESQAARALAASELAEQERERAEAQRARAEDEWRRAEGERERAEEQREIAARNASEAEAQREQAEGEARKVSVINSLLLDMLASPGPQFDGREVTVVDVLSRFADRIGSELALAPELEVAARSTIGNTYIGLGLYAEAREQLLVARDVAEAHFGEPEGLVTPDALAGVMLALGVTSVRTGRIDDAEREYEKALDIWRGEAIGADARVAGALSNLAFIRALRGDVAGAERMLLDVLDIRREVHGDHHREVAETLSNLAMMVSDRGADEMAESCYRESLAIQERVLPAADGLTVTTLSNLALLVGHQGRSEEALQLYGEALDIATALEGSERKAADIHVGIATVVAEQGDWTRAEEHARQAVALYERVAPGGSDDFAAALHQLGAAQLELDRAEEAATTLTRALAMARRVAGDGEVVLEVARTLVAAQRELGRYREAEQVLLELEAHYASLGAPASEHWSTTVAVLRELAEEAGWSDRASVYQQMLDIGLGGAGG